MAVTPTGVLSLPLANLQALVSHCAAWQAWVGGDATPANAATAKLNVHLLELPAPTADGKYTADELNDLRPFIIVNWFDPAQARRAGASFEPVRIAQGTYHYGGMLAIEVEAAVPDGYADDPNSAKLDFMNRLGALILEMGQKQQLADYLTSDEITAGLGGILINQFILPFGIERSEKSQQNPQGDYISTTVVLHVGK
jgi:hypothetical protein